MPWRSQERLSEGPSFDLDPDDWRGSITLRDPRPHVEPEPEPPRPAVSRRAALIAVAFIMLLIVGTLFLEHVLRDASNLQDCVMQGRTNCAPIDANSPARKTRRPGKLTAAPQVPAVHAARAVRGG